MIWRHTSLKSYVIVKGKTNATPQDGCALSTLSDLLCYVRELHFQNCLYGNGWKQKENAVDTLPLMLWIIWGKLYRRSEDFQFQYLLTQRVKLMLRVILLSVACLAAPYYSTMSHNGTIFGENKGTERKMCALIFYNFSLKLFHSKKNSARNSHNYTVHRS